MNIETRDQEDIRVIVLDGRLDTNTASEAQARLTELLDEGNDNVLVDLMNLDYVSSLGLRVLLVAAKKLSSRGAALRVCNLNDTVRETFEISGFDTLIRVFDTEQEALQDF